MHEPVRPASTTSVTDPGAATSAGTPASAGARDAGPWSPVTVVVTPIAAMLNAELADHPVYDAVELQAFDDDQHGRGMLVFLSRRGDRRVDYYVQPGLRLDPAAYQLGGGTGSWTETDLEVARLEVADDGVDAEVRFVDVDGRRIEVRIDDRDGRRRRRAAHLLAPVSAGIDRPDSLLLVWLSGFDLVRAGRGPLRLRIDGRDAATGRLPGARVHRRELVKYAAPLVAVEVARAHDGPVVPGRDADQVAATADGRVLAVRTGTGPDRAAVRFDPPAPDLTTLADGERHRGRWHVEIGDRRITGGVWAMHRAGDEVTARLDVDERWDPGRAPWLPTLVTRLVPVFRRWPTTYRWRATLHLGDPTTLTSRWERTGAAGEAAYLRATGSGGPRR